VGDQPPTQVEQLAGSYQTQVVVLGCRSIREFEIPEAPKATRRCSATAGTQKSGFRADGTIWVFPSEWASEAGRAAASTTLVNGNFAIFANIAHLMLPPLAAGGWAKATG
jgi:hypothetical protein